MKGSSAIDAYIRVSKRGDREGPSFISPTDQRELIEGWAARAGVRLGEVSEEFLSGGRADRPKLLRAIGRIEAGESAGIVTAHLDRFFRSQLDGLLAIERIRTAGGFFVSADGDIDTRDERGDLILGIRLSIAQDERRRRTESFASGRRRAVQRGIHPSPVPPFGYTRPTRAEGKRRVILGPLVPDPVYGPVMGELYRRAGAGESWTRLARWLERERAVSAYGASKWTARAVKDLVRNRVYLGEAHHGEFVNPAAHEPLTDELTFERAQRVGRVFPPSRSDQPALLSGLLRCAGCRRGMQSYIGRSGREYRCRRHYSAGSCESPAHTHASVIEPYVEAMFLEALGNVRARDEQQAGPELRSLEAAVAEAEAELVRFRDLQSVAGLAAEDFVAGVSARRDAFEQARAAYFDAVADAGPDPLDGLPDDLHSLWPELDIEEKRELLSAAVATVFLRRGRSRSAPIGDFAWVCFKGEAPPDLPHRGSRRNAPIEPFVFPQPRGALATDAA